MNVTGTLYEPATTLADNQWRQYFADRVQHVVSDPHVGQTLINRVKNLIVQKIPKKSVEEKTPQLIANLQAQHIVILGITQKQVKTSYADNFGEITRNHLLSLGIHLEKSLPYLKLSAEEQDAKEYTFMEGVLFTNKQPVGPSLVSFLKQVTSKPQTILMVDNSRTSLENVEEALKPTGIAFKGLRYGRSDVLKETFDATLGTIEFLAFTKDGKILSDAETLKIKQTQSFVNYEGLLDEYIQQGVSAQSK